MVCPTEAAVRVEEPGVTESVALTASLEEGSVLVVTRKTTGGEEISHGQGAGFKKRNILGDKSNIEPFIGPHPHENQ